VYASTAHPYGQRVVGKAKRVTAQDRLAASVKRERARLGWTQEQAAETAKLNIRHYQKVEEGTVNVTLRTAEFLAEAFGVDIADLFRR
jgi:transcriptional regulator with XRE-family HTH domain